MQRCSPFIANESVIIIIYALRTTIHQCLRLRIILLMKSHITSEMAGMSDMGVIASMAKMAAMAAVESSTNKRDHCNRIIHWQDLFWMSTESSLAGVGINIGMCLKPSGNRSTSGKPMRDRYTEAMLFGYSIRRGQVMDLRYLGDVGRLTRNPLGAWLLVSYSLRGMWLVTTDSRDWWWQLWPSIYKVCGLLHCEVNKALLGAVQCVLSHYTFNDDDHIPPLTRPHTGIHYLWGCVS